MLDGIECDDVGWRAGAGVRDQQGRNSRGEVGRRWSATGWFRIHPPPSPRSAASWSWRSWWTLLSSHVIRLRTPSPSGRLARILSNRPPASPLSFPPRARKFLIRQNFPERGRWFRILLSKQLQGHHLGHHYKHHQYKYGHHYWAAISCYILIHDSSVSLCKYTRKWTTAGVLRSLIATLGKRQICAGCKDRPFEDFPDDLHLKRHQLTWDYYRCLYMGNSRSHLPSSSLAARPAAAYIRLETADETSVAQFSCSFKNTLFREPWGSSWLVFSITLSRNLFTHYSSAK